MSINGSETLSPLKIGPPLVDYGTGLAGAFAIATALFQREKTGEGQHIDVAMLDTAIVMMGSVVTDVLTAGAKPKPHGNSYKSIPTNAAYATKEGTLYIAAMAEHQAKNLFRVLNRSDLEADPRYLTHELRSDNFAALTRELEAEFLTRPATEWEELLNEAGVPGMRIRTIPEAVSEPYLQARDLFHTFDKVPGLDCKVTVPKMAFKMSGSQARVDTPPPLLGAHNAEILGALGYTKEAIEQLRAGKVV
jgi:crotonobetainyl-CoA:carnitine CoA-transferase CaiB-like acyl-CoA transferase